MASSKKTSMSPYREGLLTRSPHHVMLKKARYGLKQLSAWMTIYQGIERTAMAITAYADADHAGCRTRAEVTSCRQYAQFRG
ncbi:hypothetical protein Tco_0880845 [Tanacetum coccineum]